MDVRCTGLTGSELYAAHAARYVEMIRKKQVYLDYERPMIRELARDISGKDVLDMGCGPGAHLPWLTEKAALVTAVDASEEFLQIVRRDYPRVETTRIDLNDGLSPLQSERFDLVISSLVLHYVNDWYTLLEEVHRVLRPGGRFVISTHHPFHPYAVRSVANYLTISVVDDRFGPPGQEVDVRYYHRPIAEVLNPFLRAHFAIERIEEPPFENEPLFLFLAARRL
jgi:SAM-dependent methyltransferase